MKFDIQTFTDSDESVRFTFYESWYNKSIIIVKEERFSDEDWAVVNSLSIPKDLFGLLNAKGSTVNRRENLAAVGEADANFVARTLIDRLELPLHVRRTLLERDCEEIPLYENQTGYFNDLESLEWFWDVPEENVGERKTEPTNQLGAKLALENSSMEEEGDIFMCETTSSQSVSTVPPCDETLDGGESFVFKSPQTPMKVVPNVLPDCPPAPKKRKLIRRPSFLRKMETLDFSQF